MKTHNVSVHAITHFVAEWKWNEAKEWENTLELQKKKKKFFKRAIEIAQMVFIVFEGSVY